MFSSTGAFPNPTVTLCRVISAMPPIIARRRGQWARRGSNPHAARHRNLNPACLPIPPRARLGKRSIAHPRPRCVAWRDASRRGHREAGLSITLDRRLIRGGSAAESKWIGRRSSVSRRPRPLGGQCLWAAREVRAVGSGQRAKPAERPALARKPPAPPCVFAVPLDSPWLRILQGVGNCGTLMRL